MVGRSAVAKQPPVGATLSTQARPFVPATQVNQLHHQSRPHHQTKPGDSIDKKPSLTAKPTSKRIEAKLSAKAITQAVTSNNAFLLGHNLLTAYVKLEAFKRAKERGDISFFKETITKALRSHPDPPMFIVNALITVGTVSSFKKVGPELELAISEILVQALQSFKVWHRNHKKEWELQIMAGPEAVTSLSASSSMNSSAAASPKILPTLSPEPFGKLVGHSQTKNSSGSEEPMSTDLISMDDEVFFSNKNRISTSKPKTILAQRTGSSTTSLLDEDVVKSPSLLQMAVLRPSVQDLINLMDLDVKNIEPTIGSKERSSASTPTSSVSSFKSRKYSDLMDRLTDDSEVDEGKDYETEWRAHVHPKQPMDSKRTSQKQQSTMSKADLFDIVEAFDSHLGNSTNAVAAHLEEKNRARETIVAQLSHKQKMTESDTKENTRVKDTKDMKSQDHQEKSGSGSGTQLALQPHLIQEYHRRKLVDEMIGGNNLIQMYAALEVLEMQDYLRKPIDAKEGAESYGWVLARRLHGRGRYKESCTVIFKYLENRPESNQVNTTLGSKPSFAPAAAATPVVLNAPASVAAPITPEFPVYVLPSEVQIVIVDSVEDLDSMRLSIAKSTVIGLDTEWLPVVEEYDMLDPGQRTAVVQISCYEDSVVYIVDVLEFLENYDDGLCLVQVIGELLNNSKIIKTAYDWDGDQDLLLKTFPDLYQEHYRPRNFLDLKYLWFKFDTNGQDDDGTGARSSTSEPMTDTTDESPPPVWTNSFDTSATPSPTPPFLSSGDVISQTDNSSIVGEELEVPSAVPPFEAWSQYQAMPGMVIIHGGLSGMLKKLCGYQLDKSQRCSNWEQRPLTEDQQVYASIDAWCLLDIYMVLDRTEMACTS